MYEDDEEYPIPMVPINDMNGYLCSFGLDRGGDKVEGFINQIEYQLLCNSVKKKDFCDEC